MELSLEARILLISAILLAMICAEATYLQSQIDNKLTIEQAMQKSGIRTNNTYNLSEQIN